MPKNSSLPGKPQTEKLRPELTRLPELTWKRKLFRKIANRLIRGTVMIATRLSIQGIENVPIQGPLLMVANHLGDTDVFIGFAISPRQVETIAKVELFDLPILGWLIEAYGVIWIHRGQPDRHALRAALNGLQAGRVVGIAPEGRESLTGSLEEGMGGAAYLAIKSSAPILPVTFTGTQNQIIYNNLKRFRRSAVTVTIGKPFTIVETADRKADLQQATELIMRTLASQLPVEYQGVYNQELEVDHGNQEP
jgi:1-acyl-sn-glycerol-3-phosphate acyltransferase